MNRTQPAVLIVLLMVILAGCGRFEQYPQSREALIKYDGSIEKTKSGFRMNGTYFVGGSRQPSNSTFSNTALYLYSENGELLAEERLGTFNKQIYINISINKAPEYVIINSPDFWSEGPVAVQYYYKNDGGYNWKYATSRGELPVTSPDDEKNSTVVLNH